MIRKLTFAVLLCAQTIALPAIAASFVHPGILHTQTDFNRIKSNLTVEPWASGYAVLRDHKYSSLSYAVRGGHCPSVVRDTASTCMGEFNDDANAAYQQALMWALTGDQRYADKARQILDAWSSTLTSISGHDGPLAAGFNGFKFVTAAEILRYTNAGWPAANITAAESMFQTVFYPLIKDFATYANGGWDIACMKAMMGIGVFTNDRAMFNRALDYYYNGPSNGSITHYIINTAGQVQESGRDQTHTQLGIGSLAELAETAWAQGFDLYGAYDNRLLKGFEYVASYNLGNTVPFVSMVDTTGKYPQTVISTLNRGEFRPIYEMVLNHYEMRKNIAAPYTKQVAQQLRPEGAGASADHPGFGTLSFTRTSVSVISPAGTGDYPTGFSKCANDGAACLAAKGTGLVAFGLKGKWHYKYVGVGSTVTCSASVFGDPNPGVTKKCAYQL